MAIIIELTLHTLGEKKIDRNKHEPFNKIASFKVMAWVCSFFLNKFFSSLQPVCIGFMCASRLKAIKKLISQHWNREFKLVAFFHQICICWLLTAFAFIDIRLRIILPVICTASALHQLAIKNIAEFTQITFNANDKSKLRKILRHSHLTMWRSFYHDNP